MGREDSAGKAGSVGFCYGGGVVNTCIPSQPLKQSGTCAMCFDTDPLPLSPGI